MFRNEQEEEEEDWPEEELLVEAAKAQDKADREEQVARTSRGFWAEEILLQKVWEGIKLRKELTKDVKKWIPEVLLRKVLQVTMIRNLIIKDLAGEAVEEVEEKIRKARILEARSKKKRLIEVIENRMDIDDREKERRIAKGKYKQWQAIAMDTDRDDKRNDIVERKKEERLEVIKKRKWELTRMDTSEKEVKVDNKEEDHREKEMQTIRKQIKPKRRIVTKVAAAPEENAIRKEKKVQMLEQL